MNRYIFMCKAMEDMRNEVALAKSYEIAKALWDDGVQDLERIARIVKLTLEQVKEAIGIHTA